MLRPKNIRGKRSESLVPPVPVVAKLL